MNTYIFIPDTNKKAGLGHFFRCIKYTKFIKKNNKIIFFIEKNFNKKYFIKRNLNNISIKYIYYSSLEKNLKLVNQKNKNLISFLDSYNLKKHKFNFKKYVKKHISINDFFIKGNYDYIIDHSFKREISHHNNKNCKILAGVNFFPFYKNFKSVKKDIILIDFGSIDKKNLIKKSIIFLKKMKLNKFFKIVIINKFIKKRDFKSYNVNFKFYKFHNNIEKIYKRTFFSIGACGISLYEKSFNYIPTIAKCVAQNQSFNYSKFSSHNCILDFNDIIDKGINNKISKQILFKKLHKVKNSTKKYFDYKKNKLYLANLFNSLNEN